MNDIFLSYAAEDRDRARLLATTFESHGFSVWWDREIPPGKSFDQVIEAELSSARSVVVLWSEHSVKSRWVKTEAAAAADRHCLVPILIDDVPIPFEFRRIQTAQLADWDNLESDPEFSRIVDAIRDTVSRPAPVAAHGAETFQVFSSTRKPAKARRWLGIAVASAMGIALIAVVIVILSNNAFAPETERADAAPLSDGPAAAEPSPSVPASPASTQTPTDAVTIQIGDRISDGKPVAGAGSIENAFSDDVYVFTARPRQKVFFRMVEHGTGVQFLRWRVTDELGMEVFNNCLGCGHPGVQTLVRGGRYTMRIGSKDDPATGIYSVHVINVPEPDSFQIKSGTIVREDAPGPGAGIIESPGVEDVYTFTAAPRQRIYLRVREHTPGVAQIRLRLTDENGMAIIDQCLGCGQYPAQTLVTGGTYTITVGSKVDTSTGTYSFELAEAK